MIKCGIAIATEDMNIIGKEHCKFIKARRYLIAFKGSGDNIVIYDENYNGLNMHMPTRCGFGLRNKCISDYFIVKDNIFFVKNNKELLHTIKAIAFDEYLIKEDEIIGSLISTKTYSKYHSKCNRIADFAERLSLFEYKNEYFIVVYTLNHIFRICNDCQNMQDIIDNDKKFIKDNIIIYDEKEWDKFIKDNKIIL